MNFKLNNKAVSKKQLLRTLDNPNVRIDKISVDIDKPSDPKPNADGFAITAEDLRLWLRQMDQLNANFLKLSMKDCKNLNNVDLHIILGFSKQYNWKQRFAWWLMSKVF